MEQAAASCGDVGNASRRDQDDDYFKSDHFRMSSMKVLPCSKRYVHDWTECPFAHPQEKARRRDPKDHNYTGIACPSMKKEGACAFGDHCPYAHNVFEYWLHPTRYRTQLCNDGTNCHRKICFFAHSLDELRVPACKPFVSPEALAAAAAAAAADNDLRRRAGLVGSPVANLDLPSPARLSTDSIRQSSEWGPAAMPMPFSGDFPLSGNPIGSPAASNLPETASARAEPTTTGPMEQGAGEELGPLFTAHEHQVIETVTGMLAQDRLTASQAAGILQQMLPAASLQLLQDKLGIVGEVMASAPRRAMSDPLGMRRGGPAWSQGAAPNAEQLAAMQAVQAIQAGSNATAEGNMLSGSRASLESSRSSFDTARFSLDGNRMSLEYAPPGDSAEYQASGGVAQQHPAYLPPAPAFPQESSDAGPASGTRAKQQRYWTGQALSTVPEGLPMINTPAPRGQWSGSSVRRSTGSMDSAAARLSSDFTRMSFEGLEQNAPFGVNPVRGVAPRVVDPYASAFFSGAAIGEERNRMPFPEEVAVAGAADHADYHRSTW